MAFSAGDKVIILSLKKHGVVHAVDSKGIHTVLIGDLTLRCREEELQFVSTKTEKADCGKITVVAQPENIKKLSSIDLHGLTVADAVPLVENTIDRAILAGVDRIEIVHGIGSGKIKAAVHKLLGSMPVVKNFTPHMLNPGITIVYL